jgi:hypothetical protein
MLLCRLQFARQAITQVTVYYTHLYLGVGASVSLQQLTWKLHELSLINFIPFLLQIIATITPVLGVAPDRKQNHDRFGSVIPCCSCQQLCIGMNKSL